MILQDIKVTKTKIGLAKAWTDCNPLIRNSGYTSNKFWLIPTSRETKDMQKVASYQSDSMPDLQKYVDNSLHTDETVELLDVITEYPNDYGSITKEPLVKLGNKNFYTYINAYYFVMIAGKDMGKVKLLSNGSYSVLVVKDLENNFLGCVMPVRVEQL